MGYSVYQCGSSTVPFIKNPSDIDYAVFNATEEEYEELENKYNKDNSHIVIRFYSSECNSLCLFYGMTYYNKLIEGEDCLKEPEWWQDKSILRQCLYDSAIRTNKTSKHWYMILLSVFRLEDKLDNLSDKDKEWLQLCHDTKCPQECFDYIFNYLN